MDTLTMLWRKEMIKEFSCADFQKCCELYLQVFNGPPWNDKWTNDTVSTYLRELLDHKRFLGYTLWDSDLLIGVVFCHLKKFYRGDEIFIDEMYISTDHQHKGHGTALMNEVEEFARKNSCISITLLTGIGKPAYNFYEKFGCKHLSHLAFMYKRID